MKRAALILVVLAISAVAGGDVIELHSGKKIECKIVLEDGKKVFYKTNGETKAVGLDEISGIIRSKKALGKKPENPNPAPANPAPVPPPVETPKPPAEETPAEKHPPEARAPRRRVITRTSDETLDTLFASLKTTAEALLTSVSEEEKTFYKMRAVILKKHINSCGYTAGKIALDELEEIPPSKWKEWKLYVGYLADIVSGCGDRDIVLYFWEEWMPINLERVQNVSSKTFPLGLVERMVKDLKESFDNTYRSVRYKLAPYKYRGLQRFAVEKTEMRMPK